MRFCGQCNLHVYNLSAMSEREAEELILAREGRLCVRLFKRADGTVITEDCPRGLEKVRQRMKVVLGAAAGMLAAVLGWQVFQPSGQCSTQGPGVRGGIRSVLVPPPVRPIMGAPVPHPVMGEPAPLMGKPSAGPHAPPPDRPALMGRVATPQSPKAPPRVEIMGDVAAPNPQQR